ncbi:hypothetical protein HSX37_05655|uniref:Uncharacterized protein n=1 Tax=Dendrosporobacter quercicolus TaxID=146817 RepID=A0A1G9P261_9FIRM|nr:phage tail tube protein [Dendrosporobacter quercicolus]NSL47528.1 hypothetical protein [Dendrosporobacter quercicolus DSM 1736]SDL92982.1 hypothetical protein SAMN04488502_1011207 [Dendrosporobacter quercicolus]
MMKQAVGAQGRLLLDFETVYGQNPVSKNAKVLPFNTFDVKSKQNMKDPATITGTRNPVEPSSGNVSVDGSIVTPLDDSAVGYWLKGLFGNPVTTGAAAPYRHVFKVGNTQPSMVLEKGFTDIGQYVLLNGCKISSFKLAFGGEDELTAAIEIMGGQERLSAAPYAETPAVIPFAAFNNMHGRVEEGGSVLATVTKGEFTINTGLDGNQYTIGNNGCRSDIPAGIYKISGSITALFDGPDLLQKALDGTKSSLKVNFAANNHSLEFLFPEILYERSSPGITGPAGVLISLPFQAFYQSNTDHTAVKATLVNSVESYA